MVRSCQVIAVERSILMFTFNMDRLCFLALFALVSLSPASAISVKFKDCGSDESTVEEIDISPCTEEPCVLHKGTNVTVQVKFKTKARITKATSVVHGIIQRVPVPFPVPIPDACEDQGLACPLEANQEYTFHTTLSVKALYPSIELIVKWEVQDGGRGDVDVFCWEVPLRISG
ncbi:NPC intracellular cholesterol transporter 2-like [Montipora capricornis]|uniref:NPC intracellular cholesterol transporter 2-like n=1 Tax=Montipora capricornis TaxID=246305 RepID=UPI0035F1A0AE